MLVPLFRMIYETLLGVGTVQIAEGPVFAVILAGHAFPIEHLPDITNLLLFSVVQLQLPLVHTSDSWCTWYF